MKINCKYRIRNENLEHGLKVDQFNSEHVSLPKLRLSLIKWQYSSNSENENM